MAKTKDERRITDIIYRLTRHVVGEMGLELHAIPIEQWGDIDHASRTCELQGWAPETPEDGVGAFEAVLYCPQQITAATKTLTKEPLDIYLSTLCLCINWNLTHWDLPTPERDALVADELLALAPDSFELQNEILINALDNERRRDPQRHNRAEGAK